VHPKRERALEIIDRLQMQNASLFSPRAAFDGQRNMFRSVELNFANNGAKFQVFFGDSAAARTKSKGVTVKLTRVATIDPRCVHSSGGGPVLINQFRSLLGVINGKDNYSSQSLTSLQLLNVLVRMKPIL
jgi:eukaryotic translation initiation factor 2C